MPLLSILELDRGYAFVEFEKEEDMTAAYKKVRGEKGRGEKEARKGGKEGRVGKGDERGKKKRRAGQESKRRGEERRGEKMECVAQMVLRVKRADE
jgi:RNA recognition motif-containing protein